MVINEALELARTFSTEDAVKFINGMLDGIRKKMERVARSSVVTCPRTNRFSSGA